MKKSCVLTMVGVFVMALVFSFFLDFRDLTCDVPVGKVLVCSDSVVVGGGGDVSGFGKDSGDLKKYFYEPYPLFLDESGFFGVGSVSVEFVLVDVYYEVAIPPP